MFVKVYKSFLAVLAASVLIFAGSPAVNAPATAAESRNACENANSNSNVECIFPVAQTLTGTENQAITDTTAFTYTSKFTAPVTYAITPALPSGLNFDTATGVISGTPTAASAATEYTVTMTDSSNPAVTGDAYITITIDATQGGGGGGQGNTPDRKVTICHRTHATTNPYVRITVDYNSVNKNKGHSSHDEIFGTAHVYDATINYKPKDKLWGDIIPADASGLNRWQPLNWTTLGEQIYNGTKAGCPAYNPTTYYNSLREAGVPEAKIKEEIAELDTEQQEADNTVQVTDTNNLHYTGNDAKVASQEQDKVTICHRTNATTNPYRRITVAAASIYNKKGHLSHDEIYLTHHVYDSTVTYPNNKKDWGDIIPADPTGQNRWQPLNWTTLGQQIYSGAVAGCAEQTTQEYYNVLREAGVKKKDIKKDIEEQGNVDDDPTEVAEVEYTGTDPEVEKTEPKKPSLPSNVTEPDQTLSGVIWLDLNADGLKDPDEPLLEGVEVVLYDPANPGTPVKKVKTDKKGYYKFPDLPAGDWKVAATTPDTLEVTYDSEGSNEGEVLAQVPSGGSAFTWVGFTGASASATKTFYERTILANPTAVPMSELPAWLQAKVLKLQTKQLANTGASFPYGIVMLGLALIAGAGLLFRKGKN